MATLQGGDEFLVEAQGEVGSDGQGVGRARLDECQPSQQGQQSQDSFHGCILREISRSVNTGRVDKPNFHLKVI